MLDIMPMLLSVLTLRRKKHISCYTLLDKIVPRSIDVFEMDDALLHMLEGMI